MALSRQWMHQQHIKPAICQLALSVGVLTVACSSGSTGGSTSATGGSGGSTSSSVGTAGGTSLSTGLTNCVEGESNCFSFFVTSRARLFALAQAFNGSTKGWGGDLRYGTADGLTGADKICTEIAEQSLPNNGRVWRAFLSTSTVNAVERAGSGPWYDRLNRIIAHNVTELVATRPGGITNSAILNNLPNEDGTPHHNEEAACTNLDSCADNHDVMTGSDPDGKLCTSTTCAGGPGGQMPGMDGFDAGVFAGQIPGDAGVFPGQIPGDAGVFPGDAGVFPGDAGVFPGQIPGSGSSITDYTCKDWTLSTATSGIAPRCGHTWPTGGGGLGVNGAVSDDWISQLTEGGCAPGYNLVQNGGANADGSGTVGEGGGYGAIYCLAAR